MRIFVVVLVLVVAGIGGAAYYTNHGAAAPITCFRTVEVVRGELLSTIDATGTVEPEEVVDVGAQVAGLITKFGKDPQGNQIDFNSVVENGTELAYIDDTSYQAAYDQANAALEKAQADQEQLEAKLEQAQQEWNRAISLREQHAIADTDFDTAQANFKAAKANVNVGKASIRQAEASLRVAKTNLNYTVIKSPVRGVILSRRVNIGQTVVASLNAPSLFLIAKDLRRMQVWASVNEADIGQIHLDMPVHFTVDAYPGELFHGKVTQIRMNATMTQNVVTYTVIVTTDNSNGRLLPYLTATVKFEVNHRQNILLVPNAVLRWKPETSQIADTTTSTTTADTGVISPPGPADQRQETGVLWQVIDGKGLVRAIPVILGPTDGTNTEVSCPQLKEGMRVVLSEQDSSDQGRLSEEASDSQETGSPFLPKPPKGSRPPPGPM